MKNNRFLKGLLLSAMLVALLGVNSGVQAQSDPSAHKGKDKVALKKDGKDTKAEGKQKMKHAKKEMKKDAKKP